MGFKLGRVPEYTLHFNVDMFHVYQNMLYILMLIYMFHNATTIVKLNEVCEKKIGLESPVQLVLW